MSSTINSPSPFSTRQTSSKKMSLTQTYYLAHTARGKLSSEAARSDHNLRLLVGHANLLDSLMLDLAQAEQEQESWFNASVNNASPSQPKHIQWADSIVEEPEEDWQAEDADSDSSSDSESDYDDEDIEMITPLYRVLSHKQQRPEEYEEEEYEDDQEEDYESLTLVRSPSHSQSPPELSHDSEDDSSEDESMPPSPPNDALPSFSEKQREQIVTTSFYPDSQSQQKLSTEQQSAFFDDGYYLPQRRDSPIVSAISVY